ncbi:MAG: restriction endonuclease subunit S [Comamonas sp.]|nr:restriction endonuclease subunit S [Comamonas sp.]
MTCKLSDLVIHQIGGGWGEESSKDGFKRVAVIRGTDIPRIKDGDFSSVPFRYEKQSKIPQRLLQPGDLIIEVSGGSAASGQHTGRALHITKEILSRLGGEVIPASFCKLIRLDQKEAVSGYCSYFIDLMHITKEIAVFENQSTGISNFQTSKFLEATELPLSFEAQKAVCEFLSKVDGLRLHLRYQNTALEAIAQRLFRSWFVNFDPVHAKAAGKEPEAMSAELAVLFPGEFEDSELGPIPKGWSVTTFGDAFDIKGGATPSTSEPLYWDGGTHAWATPKDMSSLASKVMYRTERQITAAGVAKISSKALPAGTVLMSSRAPVGYLAIAKAPISINQGFIAIPPTQGIPASFTVELLAQKMPDIKANAGGTTFAEISKTQFRPIKWTRPSDKVLEAFGKLVEPLYAQVHGNCLLVDSLASLRDLLLPRLISGQLSLEEAEQVVEEAMAA